MYIIRQISTYTNTSLLEQHSLFLVTFACFYIFFILLHTNNWSSLSKSTEFALFWYKQSKTDATVYFYMGWLL